MKRREFIKLLGAAPAAWPLSARAQQSSPMRKVGVLVNQSSAEAEAQARLKALSESLRKLGWIEGQNLLTEIHYAGDQPELRRRYARELVDTPPDVIVAGAGASVEALQEITHSVPVVFAGVIDPVGAGFVKSLARPGRNMTGFTAFEYSIAGKWLELLRELAPGVKRLAVVRDPSVSSGIGQFAAIQVLATSFADVELTAIDARGPAEVAEALSEFGGEPGGGVIVTASAASTAQREQLSSLTFRYRLPTVYPFRYYVAGGGLASYGPDLVAIYARSAEYVDRILKGAKPSDLPVQAPTQYRLALNVKTAKALGLAIANSLIARADEVIE